MEGAYPAGDREPRGDGDPEGPVLEMLELICFYALAAILGFGVLVVTARNTVHCALFLVANFLCVAVVYVLLGAEFLAVIQILVYAGGIVVLYLFVVMLVNLKRAGGALDTRRQSRLGFILRRRCSSRWRDPVYRSPPARAGRRERAAAAAGREYRESSGCLYELPGSVRARVDAAARGDDRGHCPREGGVTP